MEVTDQSTDGSQVLTIAGVPGEYTLAAPGMYPSASVVDEALAVTTEEEASGEDKQQSVLSPLREQDRFLPIANVARIMKQSVPSSGKISKEAKECVQECVSEFISFITSEASDRCHQEKRKTINGEDILYAMSTLGFEPYIDPLKLYLQKYRECVKGDKNMMPRTSDEGLAELTDDFASGGLTTAIITTDQSGQHVYGTTYQPVQLTAGQTLNFT